jgi:ubiquitin-like 1-activating enzyme E1 B
MFTKDDEIAVEFVTAAANIRAHNFAIKMESLFKIKEMAGKIVPAISSSNALVAALQTFEAIKILANRKEQIKGVSYVRMDKDKRLMPLTRINEPRNKDCQVCQDDS